MATEKHVPSLHPRLDPVLEGRGLDLTVAVLSTLLMLGVAADARSHAAGMSFAEEGFLTPEHAFFYSMYLAVGGVVALVAYRGRLAGRNWSNALPDGYGWAALGVVLFGVGGFGDFLWHSTFGFEQGTETLLSPTHMLLTGSGILFGGTPLRASLRRGESGDSLAGATPIVLSATVVAGALALFSAYANPIANPLLWETGELAYASGVAGFVVFPAILVGVATVLVRRFDLPPGALTVAFVLPAVVGVAQGFQPLLGLVPIGAGLAGDVTRELAPPVDEHPAALRVFGAAVGLAAGALAVGISATIQPIAWSIHLWTGAIVTAGVAGLLVTYVAVPDGQVSDA